MTRFSLLALIVVALLVGTCSAKSMKKKGKQTGDGLFYECFNSGGEQIPVGSLCDGIVDCPHQDDEWWCEDSYSDLPDVPYFPECGAGQFMCRDSSCVDGWCDGVIDCDLAEDETDCGVGPFFYCLTDDGTEYPIHVFQVCDGILDCQYEDDEANCGDESIPSYSLAI